MVEKAIQYGRSDDIVAAKDLPPLVKGLISGNADATSFIPGADQLEEQVCPAAVHGHVAELVWQLT